MKKIRLHRTEFIDTVNHPAGVVLEVNDSRAQQLVRSGAAEYYVEPPIEYATVEPPKTEKMVVKRRRKAKED